MKLLMIEDNKSVCEMMSMFFEKEKWDVEYAYDGISAVEKFKEKSDEWDMITLDLNLPGMDGMQVNAEIRKISSTVPIIILTARDSESDQILGLEMGADEYVSKPFSPITLIARIKALFFIIVFLLSVFVILHFCVQTRWRVLLLFSALPQVS